MKKKGHPSSVVDRLMDQRSSLYLTFLYISFPHLPHLPLLPFLPFLPLLSLSLSLSLSILDAPHLKFNMGEFDSGRRVDLPKRTLTKPTANFELFDVGRGGCVCLDTNYRKEKTAQGDEEFIESPLHSIINRVCKTLATTTRRRNEEKDGIKKTLAGYHSDGPYWEGEFPSFFFPLSSYADVRVCQMK